MLFRPPSTPEVPSLIQLPWDSAHFELPIGRVDGVPRSRAEVSGLLEAARRDGLRCVYLQLDAAESEAVALAQENGFAFVDARIELTKEVPP